MESQINFQTHLFGSKNTLALLGIFVFKIFEKNALPILLRIFWLKSPSPNIKRLPPFMY